MATRNVNLGPGAMTGVSQLHMNMYEKPQYQTRRSGKRRRQRDAGSTYEVQLDVRQMDRSWAHLSHPYVRMCVNEITKRLFSGQGVVATRGQEMQRVSEPFNTYLQRDMAPFSRDALDAILAFGVVPIAFRRPKTAGLGPNELAPHVPRYGTYTITTWAETGMQHFAFYWSSSSLDGGWHAPMSYSSEGPYGEPDENVLIAHDFGFDPNLNGGLTSNMHVIGQQLALVRELTSLALTGERISSNPPLVLGYDSRVDEQAEKNFGESFFVGDADRCQNREDAVYERDASRRAELANQLQVWSNMTGQDPRAEFGDAANVLGIRERRDAGRVAVPPTGATDFSGAEMPWARMYRLGVTDQHVSHQLPQTRRDYTQIVSQSMDIVCGVLNVPRGLLASESNVRAGVEAVAEAMHRTVNRYADALSHLMTGVYNHLFGISDLRDELRIRMEQRRRTPFDTAPQLLSDNDLFEARAKVRVRLQFDLPPSTTQESLNFLHDRGILSWSVYGSSMLRLNGFSRDQLDSKTDPLNMREQRVLLLGKDADKPTSSSSSSPTPKKAKTSEDHAHKTARSNMSDSKKQAAATEDQKRSKK